VQFGSLFPSKLSVSNRQLRSGRRRSRPFSARLAGYDLGKVPIWISRLSRSDIVHFFGTGRVHEHTLLKLGDALKNTLVGDFCCD
jgi:hypothetical protein